MKILVFDDNELHRKAAVNQLKNHDLVIVEDYEDAEEELNSQFFDIVLIDLMVPASREHLGSEGMRYVGQEMPLGMMIAFLAIKKGVKRIGVITDTNHHDHPASAALDALNGNHSTPFSVGDIRILFASDLISWPADPNTAITLAEEEKKSLGYDVYKDYPCVKNWEMAVHKLCIN